MNPTSPRPVRIAHGFGNSRQRLARALQGPVDLVEADVWFQGGRLRVRHERKLGPLPILSDEKIHLDVSGEEGPRLYLWRWYVRLERNPLSLEELLTRAKGRRGLLLDLKGRHGRGGEAFARALAQILARLGMEEQAAVCGQNWPLLNRLHSLASHLTIHYSIESAAQLQAFHQMLEHNPIRRICLHHALVAEPLMKHLKALGMVIYTWTVDDLPQAQELLAMGVDGIISNSLELLALLRSAPGQA